MAGLQQQWDDQADKLAGQRKLADQDCEENGCEEKSVVEAESVEEEEASLQATSVLGGSGGGSVRSWTDDEVFIPNIRNWK